MLVLTLLGTLLVSKCHCGLLERIRGGYNTTVQNAPYQVSLLYRATNFHFCGGAILSQWTVLTAAHCISQKTVSSIAVRAGSTTIKTGGTLHNVSSITKHPNFVYNSAPDYDVAVFILQKPVVYSNSIKKISLGVFFPPDDTLLTFTGWGQTDDASFSLNLQMAQLPLISRDSCYVVYNYKFTDTEFCAGFYNSTPSACSGDSGSPIAWNGSLLGLGSYASKPCTLAPQVFTNVPYLYEWIRLRVWWD